jgi:hypothetical protein
MERSFQSKSDNFKEIDSRQDYQNGQKNYDKSIAAIKEFKE